MENYCYLCDTTEPRWGATDNVLAKIRDGRSKR